VEQVLPQGRQLGVLVGGLPLPLGQQALHLLRPESTQDRRMECSGRQRAPRRGARRALSRGSSHLRRKDALLNGF
jgi:hypothetical protein